MDENNCFKSKEELIKEMQKVGVKNPETDKVILTC